MDGHDMCFNFVDLYSELLGAILGRETLGSNSVPSPPSSSLMRCSPGNAVGLLELPEVGSVNKKRRVTFSSPHQTATSYGEIRVGIKHKSTQGRSDLKMGKGGKEKVERKPLRRGTQATESHRLAERARREKINERFKRLQNLVPGCDRSMGMAVMLDEIITYIQSLQNQVEFLCMKLESDSFYQRLNKQVDGKEAGTNMHDVHMQRPILNNFENSTISALCSPFIATDNLQFTYC